MKYVSRIGLRLYICAKRCLAFPIFNDKINTAENNSFMAILLSYVCRCNNIVISHVHVCAYLDAKSLRKER